MPSAFGTLFKSLCVTAFGKGVRESARGLEPKKDEATTSSYIGKIWIGKRPPPLDRLDTWADALKLAGQERQQFIDLAYLEHAPERVRQMVTTLEKRVERMEALMTELEKKARK